MKYRDIKQPNYRHVGKYSPRKEAREIVTGKAFFLDDFSLPHMLYGRTKRSPYPHAKIVKIDTSAAEAMEGVRAVITHKNAPFLAALGGRERASGWNSVAPTRSGKHRSDWPDQRI
jgi:xanthine dehydrogenase molybdenum-binding subunit